MQILNVITSYPPAVGGAQTHAHYLNKALNNKYMVQVASQWAENRTDWLWGTTVNAPRPKSYMVDDIPVKLIALTDDERKNLKPWVYGYYFIQGLAIPRIAKILARHLQPLSENADLIHNVRIGREGLSFAALQEARRNNIPFIFTPLHHPRWGSWLHRHYHQIYREADSVLVLTQWEKETVISLGVHPEKVFVIGHGPVLADNVGPETFLDKFQIEGPIVLFLGQKYRYKGLKALLDAASLVWKKRDDVKFVLIGPRTEFSSDLFSNIRDSRIIEIDVVDLPLKTSALKAADIVCVPSTQESFGGVYLEGWLSDCAVIGGDAPAIREVISDGEDGLIATQNPKDIAEKIILLLENSQLREEMILRGKQKVRSTYTWEKIAQRVEKVYESVVN